MLNNLSFSHFRSFRRWFYPLLSVFTALVLTVGIPQVSRAISWVDLLIQGVQIYQISNVSDQQEIALGQQINAQLTGSEVRIYRNPLLTRYIEDLGQRLAAKSDRPKIPYTFQVVADNGINAFATMGGFVYINTGTIAAADNESQLASVIGHEIGHITGRHAIKQMRQTAIARGLASAAGLDRNTAVQLGVELAIRRPGSRSDELDADKRGLLSLERAGFAPSGMIGFMQKLLQNSGGGSTPSFLSTHPATADRISALKRNINPSRADVGEGLNSSAYKSKLRSFLGS